MRSLALGKFRFKEDLLCKGQADVNTVVIMFVNWDVVVVSLVRSNWLNLAGRFKCRTEWTKNRFGSGF